MHSWPRHWMEVSGQLHASATLPVPPPQCPLYRRREMCNNACNSNRIANISGHNTQLFKAYPSARKFRRNIWL
jgi:hypothetical protein